MWKVLPTDHSSQKGEAVLVKSKLLLIYPFWTLLDRRWGGVKGSCLEINFTAFTDRTSYYGDRLHKLHNKKRSGTIPFLFLNKKLENSNNHKTFTYVFIQNHYRKKITFIIYSSSSYSLLLLFAFILPPLPQLTN